MGPAFIKAAPGATITVHLKNTGTTDHTFTSAALGVDKQLAAGASADLTVTMPSAGATEFHCRFHQSQGMQGAFYFKTGDTVTGAAPAATSSSSTGGGGYN
jgi:plastocyanin